MKKGHKGHRVQRAIGSKGPEGPKGHRVQRDLVPADEVLTIICGCVRKVFEHLVFCTVVSDIIIKRIGSGCVAASGANKNKKFEDV